MIFTFFQLSSLTFGKLNLELFVRVSEKYNVYASIFRKCNQDL